jgi:hypothetical protein
VLPTKFRFIWLSGYREEDCSKSTNQKQEWPVAAMFINGWELNTFQGCFLPNFDSFGLVSHWLISKKIVSFKTALLNESTLGKNHHWKVLYKDCTFSSNINPLTNKKSANQKQELPVAAIFNGSGRNVQYS